MMGSNEKQQRGGEVDKEAKRATERSCVPSPVNHSVEGHRH